MRSAILCAVSAGLLTWAMGCASVPNYYADDSPASIHILESPTSVDVAKRFERSEQRHRDWETRFAAPRPGRVVHWPLWFEDPFVDRGATYSNRLGWEDWAAAPYCYGRFLVNGVGLPVSMVMQPPWMLMESDGRLSRQVLGYDHDAIPVGAVDRADVTEEEAAEGA